jgi:cysteine desulfuration protein SufE
MAMQGTSDALIVQGLIAVLFAIYDGKTLDEIVRTDAQSIFAELGLSEHLTQQRSNGLASMVKRIRADAEMMLAA